MLGFIADEFVSHCKDNTLKDCGKFEQYVIKYYELLLVDIMNLLIKGIEWFIRKAYKKHYWKIKFLLLQLSEATYTPEPK